MNDYPIAANAETIRLITFSASYRGGGLDEVGALARCWNPEWTDYRLVSELLTLVCTGRAQLCITGEYTLPHS